MLEVKLSLDGPFHGSKDLPVFTRYTPLSRYTQAASYRDVQNLEILSLLAVFRSCVAAKHGEI